MNVAAGSRARRPWAKLAFGFCLVASVVATFLAVDYPQSLPGAGLAVIMLVIASVDWRQRIIPDWANLAAAALALVGAVLSEGNAFAVLEALTRGAAMFLLFLAFRRAFLFWRGLEGMGLGDVKLAGVLGLWLDWSYIPLAIELACLSAIAWVLAPKLLFGRRLDQVAKIPFGAFLAPAIWITWLSAKILT